MAVRKTSGRAALTEYWLEQRFGPPLRPVASLVGAKLGHRPDPSGCGFISPYRLPGGRRSGLRPAPQHGRAGGVESLSGGRLCTPPCSSSVIRGPERKMTFASELPQDIKTLLSQLNGVK